MLGKLFEMPVFSTIDTATVALDKIIESCLGIQFSDDYSRKGQRYRSRVNNYADHFVARCRVFRDKHEVESDEYEEWNDLMTKCLHEKEAMVETKKDIRSIGVFVQ